MRTSKLISTLASVSCLSFIAACSTVTEADRAQVAEVAMTSNQTETEGPADSNTPGRVILHRTWNGEGLAFLGTGPKVEIDGIEVGRCLLGDGTEIAVSPGEHEISAPHSQVSARRFRIFPGQVIYAECKYTVGTLVPNVQFEFTADRVRNK